MYEAERERNIVFKFVVKLEINVRFISWMHNRNESFDADGVKCQCQWQKSLSRFSV